MKLNLPFVLCAAVLAAGCKAPNQREPIPQKVAAPALATPANSATNRAVTVEPPAPVGPLTLQDAIDRAEARNPHIKAMRAAVTVAKRKRMAATDIEDPELLAGWGNGDDDFWDNGKKTEKRIGARVHVPDPFAMKPRASARTAEWQAANADLAATCWRIESDIKRLYGEIDYVSQDLALCMDQLRENGEVLKAARARVEQGAATASAIVVAGEKELHSQNQVEVVGERLRLLRRELAGLIDLPVGSLQIVSSNAISGDVVVIPQDFSELERAGLQGRSDLASLRWKTAAAKSNYHEARAAKIPWIKDVSVWHRDPSGEWLVTAGVTVPLFSWTKNHKSDVLMSQYELAFVNETNGVDSARREIRNQWDELQEQEHRMAESRSRLAPLIAEMRRTLTVLNGAPSVMPSEVAEMEVELDESLRLELAARWRYQLARLNLERAVGKALDEQPNGSLSKP